MVHTYVLQHVDLHKLRNSKTKDFFNLDDCGGPDCAQALEQNLTFVLELCATLSGADPWPRHKKFKADLACSARQSVNSWYISGFAHRQFGTKSLCATVSSQRGQQSGQSRLDIIYIACFYWSGAEFILISLAVLQAWASIQGGYARGLGLHALTLCSRAASSRCCRCLFGGFQHSSQSTKCEELASPPHQAVCAGSFSSRQI